MKKRINPIFIITATVIFIGTLLTIYFFNKMHYGIEGISEGIKTGTKQQNFLDLLLLNYKLAISFVLLLQLVAITVIIYSALKSTKFDSQMNDLNDLIEKKEIEITELKKELDVAHVQLENANTMAERTARFMNLIQKADELGNLTSTIISEVCRALEASQGAFFIHKREKDENEKDADFMRLISSYAYHIPEGEEVKFRTGEGLVGQVAKDAKILHLKDLPEGHIEIISGLGASEKAHLLLVPILSDAKVVGIMEIAAFHGFSEDDVKFVDQIAQNISTKLSVLVIN